MASKSEDWRSSLIKNRVQIVKNLSNANEVADCLYKDKILTEEMRDTIFQIHEPEKKTRNLLDILFRRGKHGLSCLYNAFQQTANEDLADLLIDYLVQKDDLGVLLEPVSWPPTKDDQDKMANVNLLKIKSLRTPWLHKYNYLDDVYKMQNKIRGKVIIINNEKFNYSKLRERDGSQHDVKNMTELFKELQFEVTTNQKDLSAEEMLQYLKDVKRETNWKEMECLVLFFMSHGENGCIYGSDGRSVKLNDLTKLFSNDACQDLDGKPKLVFVQACREDDEKTTSQGLLDPEHFRHAPTDFLVAFATYEGMKSYRHIEVGSWFLCAVMWAFKYYAYKEELHHLLIRVNRYVSRGKGEPGFDAKFAISEVKSNLRKKLYFFPGVHGNPARLLDNEEDKTT